MGYLVPLKIAYVSDEPILLRSWLFYVDKVQESIEVVILSKLPSILFQVRDYDLAFLKVPDLYQDREKQCIVVSWHFR